MNVSSSEGMSQFLLENNSSPTTRFWIVCCLFNHTVSNTCICIERCYDDGSGGDEDYYFFKYKLTLFTKWRNYPCIICSNYKYVIQYFSVTMFTLEQAKKAQKGNGSVAVPLL